MPDFASLHTLQLLERTADNLRHVRSPSAAAIILIEAAHSLSVAAIQVTRDCLVDDSERESLLIRTLEDLLQLEIEVQNIRTQLLRPDGLETLLHPQPRTPAVVQAKAKFTRSLDLTLKQLLHLMQYESNSRVEADVAHGFTFTADGSTIHKFNFPRPKRNTP